MISSILFESRFITVGQVDGYGLSHLFNVAQSVDQLNAVSKDAQTHEHGDDVGTLQFGLQYLLEPADEAFGHVIGIGKDSGVSVNRCGIT